MANSKNDIEVRFKLDRDYAQELLDKARAGSTVEMTRDALTLFHWALGEVAQGRLILSTDERGENPRQIVMPSLERGKSTRTG